MDRQEIKETRRRLGLSQERFAHLVGVSLQTVRRWEKGATRPLPGINLKLEELRQKPMMPIQRLTGIPPGGSIPRRIGVGEPGVSLGLGEALKGLGNFFDLVSRATADGSGEATPGRRFKGVYGLTVRLGRGGKLLIQQFGNIQETAAGTVVAEVSEPIVDVLDEGDYLLVITELPGVDPLDIYLGVAGEALEIRAEAGDRKYHKQLLLPAPVEAESLTHSYRNGVLEIKLVKAQAETAEGGSSALKRNIT